MSTCCLESSKYWRQIYAAMRRQSENCSSYLDKIRAFFVPSLEYRVYSLLEEFLYSADSRWRERFLHFKKFVRATGMRRTFPNETAECDISAIGGVVRNVVIHVLRNDLVCRFLDSIILRHRLNKICRELSAIVSDTARSSNARSLVDESNPTGRNWLTCPDIGADFTKSAILGAESLTRNCDVNRNGMIGQPLSSEYRALDQVLDTKQNRNHVATESRSDDEEVREATRKTSRSAETKTHRSCLKIIIRKVYTEDCSCSTLSRPAISRLRLPCEPSDLTGRIFHADPSLAESCLIVIRRKFQADMRNLCSCLNDALEKANAGCASTLRLYCEIRSGYIGFKLKIDKLTDKCLFVARVPICQNVPKHAVKNLRSRNSVVSCCNSSPSAKANEPKRTGQCKDDGNNFCDTPVSVNEGSEMSNGTCCASDRGFVKSHAAINTSQCKTENSSEKVSTIARTNNHPERTRDLIVSCCEEFGEYIVEREDTPNATSRSVNPEESAEEYWKTSDSIEINCDNVAEEHGEKLIDSNNPTVVGSLTSDANFRTSCESSTERNNAHASDNDGSSQTGGDDKRGRAIRSSDKELHRRDEDLAAAASSIVSFVQRPENDKQLVELNCNCFSDNYNEAIGNEHSDPQDGGSLNSMNAEIGRDSDFPCPADDFINIAVAGNISDDVYAFKRGDAKTRARTRNYAETTLSDDNLLTTSIQTSRLKVSSKGITVDISYPQINSSIAPSASDDKENISTVVRTCDGCNKRVKYLAAKEILPIVTRRGSKTICDRIGFDSSDRTRGFTRSRKRFPISKKRLGSSDSHSEEDFYTETNSAHVTSGASRYRRFSYSTASEFATSNKRDKSRNALRKPFKFRQRGRSSSSNDIPRVNTFAAMRYNRTSCRCQNDDYHGDTRPQVIFVLAKFRNSVDRSLGRIRRLIYAKLDGVLSNNRTRATNMWKTLWKNEESSEYTRKPNRKYSRQDYSITSCSLSTSDYCKQGCVYSSESSDVTLSILRNRNGESSGKGKFCDYGFASGSEVLASVRSIEASLWSHDLLTPTRGNFGRTEIKR